MNYRIFAAILVLAALFSQTACESWQASGNLTDDNMTFIRAKITEGRQSAIGKGKPDTAVQEISNLLNAEWESAWNVVEVVSADAIANSIVYGYAFRNHWVWFNNWESLNRTFIIWKDYNCQNWTYVHSTALTEGSFASDPDTGFTEGQEYKSSNMGDIWKYAFQIMAYATIAIPNSAYTIVAMENTPTAVSARVCLANSTTLTNYKFYKKAVAGMSASFFFMRMR